MPVIESYDFGEIIIDRRRYFNDVIIFPDRVKSGWWRREGHKLSIEDLEEVLKERPQILIIGTGYSGLMKVPEEVKERLNSLGIKVIVEPTREACRTYNAIMKSEGKKVIAALHLTC